MSLRFNDVFRLVGLGLLHNLDLYHILVRRILDRFFFRNLDRRHRQSQALRPLDLVHKLLQAVPAFPEHLVDQTVADLEVAHKVVEVVGSLARLLVEHLEEVVGLDLFGVAGVVFCAAGVDVASSFVLLAEEAEFLPEEYRHLEGLEEFHSEVRGREQEELALAPEELVLFLP